jgi:hypothetical protein
MSKIRYGGSIKGGTPIAGWFIRENPNLEWIITRDTPIYGNLHIYIHEK